MPKNHSRFTRLARTAVLLAAITVSFSALVGTGVASATTHPAAKQAHVAKKAHATKKANAAKKAHDAGSMPAEGMFDNCNIGTSLNTCEQDLQVMHRAGLQVAVVGLWGDPLSALSAYAAYAQNMGMSVMWEINDPGFWGGQWNGSAAANDFPAFATSCGCTGTTPVLNYIVQWLGALPATYGFYAADDSTLNRGDSGGLTQMVKQIKSVDPSDTVMIGSTQEQGTNFYPTGATIGNEVYPETTSDLMPAGQNLASWDSVQQSATQDAHAASQYGTRSAFILQAFSFGDNLTDGEDVGVCNANMSQARCASLLHYPSASVQLQLRNEILEHAQPKLILWYTFSQAHAQADRWSGLSNVIKAPYPATAAAARAKHSKAHKKAAKRVTKKD
jgi:hypothetical protein